MTVSGSTIQPQQSISMLYAYGASDRGNSPHRDDLGDTFSGMGFNVSIDMVLWGETMVEPDGDEEKMLVRGRFADKEIDPIGYSLGVLASNKLVKSQLPKLVGPFLPYEWVAGKVEATWRAGTTGALPVLADVLGYIRHSKPPLDEAVDKIRKLEAAPPPRVAVGLSLGGIVLVDALARLTKKERPEIDLLVTVGSQSPVLYACDALLEVRKKDRQPPIFTPWLNIWSRTDFLSYPARPVFSRFFPYLSTPTRDVFLRDVESRTGQPFPEVHSSYFRDATTYLAILRALQDLNLIDRTLIDPNVEAQLAAVTMV
jgi:hypothetical protein